MSWFGSAMSAAAGGMLRWSLAMTIEPPATKSGTTGQNSDRKMAANGKPQREICANNSFLFACCSCPCSSSLSGLHGLGLIALSQSRLVEWPHESRARAGQKKTLINRQPAKFEACGLSFEGGTNLPQRVKWVGSTSKVNLVAAKCRIWGRRPRWRPDLRHWRRSEAEQKPATGSRWRRRGGRARGMDGPR